MKIRNAYSRFLDILDKICYYLIAIMMVIMVAVMVYQVVLRYVFDRSNLWSEEVARYLCVYVTFIGSFIAIRRNSHLKVDFFVELLNPKLRKILMLVTSTAITLFLIYMANKGVEMVRGGFRNVTAGLNIPMAYVYIAIPVGCVLMILGMLEQILKLLFPDQPVEEGKGAEQ